MANVENVILTNMCMIYDGDENGYERKEDQW